MTALVRAELVKLRTIAASGWLLLCTVALVVFECIAFTLGSSDGDGTGQAGDPHLFAETVATASAGEIVLMVMGILAVTQELRFGTATSTFLVSPHRGRVVAAKMLAVAVVGGLFTVVSMAIAVPLTAWLVHVRTGHVLWEPRVAEVLAGVILVMLLYGPLGIAIGSLVRNQIAAIAGAFSWLFLVEGAIAGLSPEVAEWTPAGATSAVMQIGTWAGADHVAPAWAGVLLLVAYASLLAVLGARVTLRRDLA